MQFSKVTPEQFDKTVTKWHAETSRAESDAETDVVEELREESRICGWAAKEAEELLKAAVTRGGQRGVLAGLFSYGVRYGWHLRRLLHEREELQGLMTDADFEEMRREIRERA